MILFDDVSFRLEPWPVGVAKKFFSPDLFDELSRTFPEVSLMRADPGLGNRLSLTAHSTPRAYRRFFRTNHAWKELKQYVESRDFLVRAFAMLSEHGVDFGDINALLRRAFGPRLRALMTLAVFPADGGFLWPHTDSQPKLINFAVCMARPGEWSPDLGGTTDIVWPNDPRNIFDTGTKRLPFDAVHVLDRIPYVTNQAVIVVKTYNSWHSVGPMQAKGSGALRKTLNINIVRA